MNGKVTAVSISAHHNFSKSNVLSIRLVEGLGIEGDAHMGTTVKHRHLVAKNPAAPNLRQVHLIHQELFSDVDAQGFKLAPGEMGENITTCDIDLLSLPRGARLHLGDSAIVEITGLRNPCVHIDRFQQGLKAAMLATDENGEIIRKSGVMSIVIAGGDVRPDDAIRIEMPTGALKKLEVV